MTSRTSTRTAQVAVGEIKIQGPGEVYELHSRQQLIDPLQVKVLIACAALGSKAAAARYFEVARSQPGRWISGAERPKPRARRLVQDLDYVWDRLTADRTPEAAQIWLRSANAFLQGVTPLDWLKSRGAEDVIAAIDAEEAGSYA